MIMQRWMILVLLAGFAAGGAAVAADGMVTILSPGEGSSLDVMGENRINYDVVPGPRGDHVHLYVDGSEVAVLRQLKGSYALPTLAAGERDICIKVVNKGHTPIGIEKCVQVTVR